MPKRGSRGGRKRFNKDRKTAQKILGDRQVRRELGGRKGKGAIKSTAKKAPVQGAESMGLVHRPGMGSETVDVREAYKARGMTEAQTGTAPSALARRCPYPPTVKAPPRGGSYTKAQGRAFLATTSARAMAPPVDKNWPERPAE
jgi:hypothetical protein